MKKLFKTLVFASLLSLISCGNNVEKSRLFYDKGMDYLYSSQFEEAIEQFDQSIRLDSQNHEAYFYRGCAKYNIFQKEDAVNDYLKTIELNPEYLQAYFNLGLYYRSINDHDMACYYFKIAEDKGRPNMEDYTKHCR
ncbi:MAG: tetratricopeptide repeat protein [Lentimicrobiaceae bacterium]|nr:tetratricopeptide repeat protein [Lentimicrobiaceae bacterium]